ncbi:VTT domain-containing protein [Rhodoferax sp.]|uniref:VTT domain-containing protein n=1 Tax=Rhodoferax sp. TaxID=50421 RepID=UPI00285076D6|nr:VTT domain-containing protein [Rhodoferax sp.]MDR3369762.1 VTT domain-containing protein [Rhodoferax sp.]
MITTGLLSWFGSDQGMMTLLAQNWLFGVALIAAVIFCETGLVILPFLPGDTLLFACGTFLGISGMSPALTIAMITLTAVARDSTNYAIGRSRIGQFLVRRGWIKPSHLAQTKAYFNRFGGSTVTIGRFVPLVRTVAPFMAGLSGMCPKRFLFYNVIGALVWCASLIMAGFWFGQMPWVQAHLTWMSMGIVALSMLPVVAHLRPQIKKISELTYARFAG